MKKVFLIIGSVAVFFLLTLTSYGEDLQKIFSQKEYTEISQTLSEDLKTLYKTATENLPPENCSNEVSLIIVNKPKNVMYLYDTTNCLVKQYEVRLGTNYGPKRFEGDKKTPEGAYLIQNKYESKKYEKFLAISYPTPAQEKYAQSKGLSAGDAVGIHFFASEKKRGSMGCITVKTKEEINEIYELVNIGTRIIILPDNKK